LREKCGVGARKKTTKPETESEKELARHSWMGKKGKNPYHKQLRQSGKIGDKPRAPLN